MAVGDLPEKIVKCHLRLENVTNQNALAIHSEFYAGEFNKW